MPRLAREVLAAVIVSLVARSATAIPLRLHGPSSMNGYARQIESIDPRSFTPLLELTGAREPQPPIDVELAPERSPTAAGAPRWVSGWALGDSGIVVLIPERAGRYPDDGVDELLRHELTHVLEARAARGSEIPRWFNEGLAMFAARGWQLEDRTRLAFAMMRGDPTPIADLDALFSGGEVEMARAYAISGAVVRDLILRHGRAAPGDILRRLAAGEPFSDAFQRATGQPLHEFEAEFWRRQTIWNRWVPFLTSSLALWIGITLLAIWAIGKRKARDRRRAAAWAEMMESDVDEEVEEEPVN